MLKDVTELILKHFPDPDPNIPYVRERFHSDWTPDMTYKWQQNRAIVGHNYKISWNLQRVANYFSSFDEPFAAEIKKRAVTLGNSMSKFGIDQIRGGCYDAVEREPKNGMPIEFVWQDTKDFWQQEQGILAYLILHGTSSNATEKEDYLKGAREMASFWNLFYLDHDNRGIFFRVTDNGLPVVQGAYANKASHALAGYHSFELNFLAHMYIRSYIDNPTGSDENFVLYFKPEQGHKSINVMPDFFPAGHLEIANIQINGIKQEIQSSTDFQINLKGYESSSYVAVEFKKVKKND